jgi:O-antigen/teichoic acid export membrane protein
MTSALRARRPFREGGRGEFRQRARNFSWMLLLFGFRTGSQTLYFFLVVRILDVAEFGAFAACLALASAVAPFATWGTGYLIVRDVSRDERAFGRSWGNSLLVTGVLGVVGTGLVAGLSAVLWGPTVTIATGVLVAAAELLAANCTQLASQAFIAVEQHRLAAAAGAGLLIARLLGAVAAWQSSVGTLVGWCVVYAVVSAAGASAAVLLVWVRLARPEVNVRAIVRSSKDGGYFAVGLASQTLVNDLDKVLVARWDTFTGAGTYAAAYRVVGVGCLPVSALLATTFATFFRAGGAGGLGNSLATARKILPLSIAIGLVCSALLYVGAPLVPVALGSEYDGSVPIIRILAVVPLLKSVHYFAADALSGADHQLVRSAVQIGVVLVNAVLTVFLLVECSIRGAAVASVVTEGLLVVCMWSTAVVLNRSTGRGRRRSSTV